MPVLKLSAHLLPYGAALLVGVIAGTIADSPTVAGLAALVFAAVWTGVDRRSGAP